MHSSVLLHHHCLIVGLPLVKENNGCVMGFCVCVPVFVGGWGIISAVTLYVSAQFNSSLQNSFTDLVLGEITKWNVFHVFV